MFCNEDATEAQRSCDTRNTPLTTPELSGVFCSGPSAVPPASVAGSRRVYPQGGDGPSSLPQEEKMPYLNLDPDYFSHPKTTRLTGLLGPDAAVYPIRLWAYCAKYHPTDGRFPGYSLAEIDSVIGWFGEPEKAATALIKVGFLEGVLVGETTIYACHDWSDHQGHIKAFKERSIKANRKRWNKIGRTPTRTPSEAVMESSLPNLPIVNTLVEKWNKIPGVRPVKHLAGGLKTRIALRLREHRDMAWWETLFARVAASDWLSGRNRQGWCATLDWVLGPKNLEKILAGNYDNRANPQATPTRVPT